MTATALIVGSLVGFPGTAKAANENYAEWTISGTGGNYTGTMTLPHGLPAATFTSDSRAPAQLNSGATTWLSPATPFGATYGSSEDEQYPNLRPVADRPDAPSTTTYRFAAPTPTSGWGFALADVDADDVTVIATDANGNPVPVAGLGFQSVFNFCDASPRPAACAGETPPYDIPTWVPDTTSGTLVGHDAAADTVGSTGWFQPTVPLSTLTFVFRQRAGLPVYQTWFAALPPEPSPSPTPSPSSTTEPTVEPAANVAAKPRLPGTGNNSGILVLIGLAAVFGGVSLLRVSRRASLL